MSVKNRNLVFYCTKGGDGGWQYGVKMKHILNILWKKKKE